MDPAEDALEKLLRTVRQLTDESLADVERRVAVLEAACLSDSLPLIPITDDTNEAGCGRQRMALLKRRIDRLERETYRLR